MQETIVGDKLIKYEGSDPGSEALTERYSTYVVPEGITQIAELAFSGAKQMSSVELPETVESIGNYAFLNCYSLTEIKMPKRVNQIGAGLFQNCWKLRSVSLPEGLENLGTDMFESCHSLVSLTLPKSLKTIERTAFSGCKSLREIYIDPEQLGILPSSAKYNAALTFMEIMQVARSENKSNDSASADLANEAHIKLIDTFVASRQRAMLDLAINRRSINAIKYMLEHNLVKRDALKDYLIKSADMNRVEITALLLEFGEQMRSDSNANGLDDTPLDDVLNEDPFA